MPANNKTAIAAKGAAAGLVPVALALLVQNAVVHTDGEQISAAATAHGGTTAVKCAQVENMRDCHSDYPTGCSPSGGYDPYLNLLKNTLSPPAPGAGFRYLTSLNDYADLESKTPKGVSKSNHFQFKDQLAALGEGQTMGLIGYLYYAKQSGAESSNCELTGDEDVDYHIGIGFDPAEAAKHGKLPASDKSLTQTSVIVEMTPHWRAFKNPNWNIDGVKAVVGRQVRVLGQLMLDSEHYPNPQQNCGLAGADTSKCWRASAWELHPVTQFQVCPADKTPCAADSKDWVELEDAAAKPAK